MTPAAASLHALTRALRGAAPRAATNWTAVIELANRSWLTPALYCALVRSGRVGELPTEAREYLRFIHERTRDRNRRLRSQLLEAIAALNAAAMVPTVLKGAVGLLEDQRATIGGRLMSDIDMAVCQDQLELARECLSHLGYRKIEGDRGMARPRDAAMVELRALASPPPVDVGLATSLLPCLLERDGVKAWIPSATSQALHLIRHDMLKEGDYWRGRIDLRHLHDLALLAADGGVDWICLAAAMPGRRGRNVLETQVLTLRTLFDANVPHDPAGTAIARVQNWRRIAIVEHPTLAAPMRLVGNLLWGMHRAMHFDGLLAHDARDLLRRTSGILSGTNTGPKI